METIIHNDVKFKILNGTYYDSTTPNRVVEVLEAARLTETRIKIDYGHENGESWGEINDVTGYVGRSTGPHKVAILLHNSRSRGGGAILTHCIVKIETSRGKKVLYKHPKYKPFTE